MNKKMMNGTFGGVKVIALGLAILLLASLGVACAKKPEPESAVRVVKIAYAQAAKPITFTDEDGKASGYDVEVMRLVDERLADYSFEFIGTSDEDALIGTETGAYAGTVKNVFFTEERAQKYIYPKENVGGSNTGLVVRKANAADIIDLSTLAAFSGKLVPIAPQSAQYALVRAYNEQHPEAKIELESADDFNLVDAYTWVAEGRYDAFLNLKALYSLQVEAEDAPYAHLADALVYQPFAAIPTWPLFNKAEQDLADQYDKVIAELKEEGKLRELSLTWYGEDVFDLLDAAP